MSPIYTLDESGVWTGPGVPSDQTPPAWIDTFVLGDPQNGIPLPNVNVGAGVFENRAFPTQSALGHAGVTYNDTSKVFTVAAGVLVQDRVFPGFVDLADGAEILNCFVSGPPTEKTTLRALVRGPTGETGQGKVTFCTIDPTAVSSYYDGIGKGIYAKRTWILNVTDGVMAHAGVGGQTARIKCEGVRVEKLAQLRPDVANPRPFTHNDGIQCQGNPGGDNNDIFFDGCWVDGRHSTTKGTLPPTAEGLSAIMITPQNSVGAVHGTFKRGWLLGGGGEYCVNAGSDLPNMDTTTFILTDNRFERPGTDAYEDGLAPSIAIGRDTSMTMTTSGNTYIDNGAAVPVTNA